jgi:hypothetical protein
LLEEEAKNGYFSKEFIINDATPGKWLINFEGISETNTLNPTILKYTLYKNYGLANQTKEAKLIDISRYNTKVTLDSFLY